jgi:hypothetical protein
VCGGNIRQPFYKAGLSWRGVCEVLHFYKSGSPAVAGRCPRRCICFCLLCGCSVQVILDVKSRCVGG